MERRRWSFAGGASRRSNEPPPLSSVTPLPKAAAVHGGPGVFDRESGARTGELHGCVGFGLEKSIRASCLRCSVFFKRSSFAM